MPDDEPVTRTVVMATNAAPRRDSQTRRMPSFHVTVHGPVNAARLASLAIDPRNVPGVSTTFTTAFVPVSSPM